MDADCKPSAYAISDVDADINFKAAADDILFLKLVNSCRYLRESSASFNLDRNCEEVKYFLSIPN